MTRARLAMALAAMVVLAGGCGITRIDAPVTFKADHRLDIVEPEPEEEVELPMEVAWDVEDFERTGGNHFGLFVDRVPIGPKRAIRLRVCTEGEKQPPQLGSFRKPCKDDRETIFFTTDTSFTFDCFEIRFDQPERSRNTHTVSLVLLDAEERRIGEAVDTIKFEVDEDDARRCRGL